MSEHLEPQDGLHDGLIGRIHALGQTPIDPATQSQHLTAMAHASAAPSALSVLGGRLRVAGALVVGFLIGTTGLASAGALGPLQPIAATAVEAVTPLNVPDGHANDHAKKATSGADVGTARYHGAECTGAATGTYKNHGQYIKAVRTAHPDDEAAIKAAAESDCGKPLSAVNGGDDESSDTADTQKSTTGADKSADAKTKSQGDENGKGACAGGADNANAGGVGDERSDAAADNSDAGSAKPAEDATGKPACADDAGKPADAGASKKPATAGAQGESHKSAATNHPSGDDSTDGATSETTDTDTADSNS